MVSERDVEEHPPARGRVRARVPPRAHLRSRVVLAVAPPPRVAGAGVRVDCVRARRLRVARVRERSALVGDGAVCAAVRRDARAREAAGVVDTV
eukprot:2441242-Rhodomonas_salina.1